MQNERPAWVQTAEAAGEEGLLRFFNRRLLADGLISEGEYREIGRRISASRPGKPGERG